ncbi:MAG: NfeD family protein [Acidobacteria bacterium]|nr:NfeD family protein [Acidobacteriota bacterium]MCI0723700.1 NfeD family protein [Acidobacteriota bacterium]
MLWWIWILLGFFLLLVELLTPGGLYLLFFGAAAIIVGMLGGLSLSGPPWMQWLMFSVLSIVALSLFRRPLMKRLRPATQGKEVDSLVGETALVLEDMAIDAIGKAELRGSAWSARNVGGNPLARGQRCTVERVDGLMLYVRA